MRQAARGGLRRLAPPRRVSVIGPLLRDSIRAVRIEAARVLASVPEETFSQNRLDAFKRTFEEYVGAMEVTSERPRSQLNLGQAYQQRGQTQKARRAFQTALQVDSTFVPGPIQLVRLNNQQGQNQKAESLLRRTVSLRPKPGNAENMLGLLLSETEGPTEAASHLQKAARLLPERARVHCNYGLALQRLRQRKAAEKPLRRAHEFRPSSRRAQGLLRQIRKRTGGSTGPES